MNNGKVILGLLAGGAIGAILGILFAPDNGLNTRNKIAKKSNKIVDDMEGKFREFANSITGKFEEMMTDPEKGDQNGKSKVPMNDLSKATHTNG